ncbi:MAG: protein kinase [Candidatus Aminicenantes bacterium]|nr:protein kinase [Candidatus Aminicenantes bacterium]
MTIKCPQCHSENPETKQFCADCGTQLIPPTDAKATLTKTLEAPKEELTTGSTFAGRYQIIEELGKGGMGKVYKVFDQEVQAKMALKLIKPEVSADKNTIDRFRNELKIARDISHKNICRMYDLGRETGNYFITMEYVSGEDLKSFIRRARQLVVGTAILIAKQVCDGLAEAHRVGVVHRDLKPGNIMIDKEGNAKIMDFGIARSISVKGITGAGVMIGTPEYMSPEQVEGKEVDQRSDIYSLGIILYEMLTGQVPFEGDTPFTIGVKQKSEIPKDPKSLNAQIPQDLSRLILKCLEKDKERRYQNADELKANLEKIEKGIPTAERPVPKRKTVASRPITLTVSRKKLLVPLSILFAIAVIAVSLRLFLPKHRAVPPPAGKPTLAILYFKNNTGDKNLDVWRDGLSRMLSSDLSQSKYIRVLPDDQIYSLLSKLNALAKDDFSTEDLREMANRGGASHLLRGIITKSGDSFRIQATLQETRNLAEIAGNYSADGIGEGSFFGMIDELTREIKTGLNISGSQIAGDVDRSVGEMTTASPEAYKLCSEGYRLNYRGEFRKAVEALEQAVKIDPKYASAFVLLGAAYAHLGYPLQSNRNYRRALELSDRLPEKDRLFVESMYYGQSEKTYDKSIEAYRRRLRLDPNDLNAARNFGIIYSALEQWDKALELYETNIRNKVEAYFPYRNAAEAYEAKGFYDKAQAVLEDYRTFFRDNAAILRGLANNYLCQGRYDLALKEVDKAFLISPDQYANLIVKGDVQLLQGDFIEAEKDYRKLFGFIEKPAQLEGRFGLMDLCMSQGRLNQAKEEAKRGIELCLELDDKWSESNLHWSLGYIYIKIGDPAAAITELEKARSVAEKEGGIVLKIYALHLKGLALLEMRSVPEAQALAVEIKKLVDNWLNPKLMRYYDHLKGMIELRKENFPVAIGDLEKAVSLLDFQHAAIGEEHALFIEPLALALYKSGNLDKAREQYDKITQLTTGRLYYGDIYASSFYMLGKIAEQQGDKVSAREKYRKFLNLWKDADPGQPEVEDARKRLAGLE